MRSVIIGLLAAGLLLIAVAARACEAGHWIENVSDDGRVVVLEDGSVWLVDDVDTVFSMTWVDAEDIVACQGKLINLDENEAVDARRVR